MNTLSINPTVFQQALLYAQKHNISIEKLVETQLLKVITMSRYSEEAIKREKTDDAYTLADMKGLFPRSNQTREEMRDEYLTEKYGL